MDAFIFPVTATFWPRANICSRYGERVLVVLGQFEAVTFEELFQHVKSIPLEDYIEREGAFPVKGWTLKSQLHSVPDCQSIIKKAIVERLKTVYKTDWFEETGAIYQIQFSIMKDQVTIMLDNVRRWIAQARVQTVGKRSPHKRDAGGGDGVSCKGK